MILFKETTAIVMVEEEAAAAVVVVVELEAEEVEGGEDEEAGEGALYEQPPLVEAGMLERLQPLGQITTMVIGVLTPSLLTANWTLFQTLQILLRRKDHVAWFLRKDHWCLRLDLQDCLLVLTTISN